METHHLKSPIWEDRQKFYLLAAVVSALLVIVTPIGTRAVDYFTLHMIQHITLMMVTGPLFVLATPVSWRPSSRFFLTATHPIISWLTYAALMIGVHLPGPHGFIMENPWVHDLIEVPLYLLIPYFFYFNLLDRRTSRRVVSPAMSVISLFLMMVPETLTGFFIYVAPNSLYDGMYTLNDQRRGGSFMWSGAMFIDVIWMSFAVYHWIKSEEKKSIEIDAQIAKESQGQ
ncbi:unannotated protein [freshwater metagenome]|uniref:Unannotated protein n=1 Tax=freshwater metagenome TaxID=449393 RepID=A0A6J7XV63_9ZZZZ|nr:hypothetical protein [Actinomycetota bacterium]